jgi:hypothetical protein
MQQRFAGVLAVGMLGALVACSSSETSSSSSSGGTDGGASSGSSSGGSSTSSSSGGTATGCTDIKVGIESAVLAYNTTVPVGTGGTVADGSYVATTYEAYGKGLTPGPTSTKAKGGIRITGNTYETSSVVTETGKTPSATTSKGTFVSTGNALKTTDSCRLPADDVVPAGGTYTAAGDSLTLFNPEGANGVAIVVKYKKQ